MDFLKPTSSVRYVIVDAHTFNIWRKVLIVRSDTLEQIDISHQLIHKYSDVRIALSVHSCSRLSRPPGIIIDGLDI